MTFEQAKAVAGKLYDAHAKASAKLNAYPKLPNGCTPDGVKLSTQYRIDNAAYNAAHKALRTFNQVYTKLFAKELAAERAAKRAVRS